MGELIHLPQVQHGREAQALDWRLVARAKRMMRNGLDLYEAALALQVRPRDLDLSLWNYVDSGAWL